MTQKNQIEELMGFYIQNPTVPCVFEHAELSAYRSKTNAVGNKTPLSQSSISPTFDVSIDGDMKTITLNGADDIYSNKVYNKDGELKNGISLDRIYFKNGKIVLFGDSNDKKSIRAMEYLFTLSVCYPSTYNKEIIKHVSVEEQTQTSTVSELDKFKLAKLIEDLSKISDGNKLLVDIAKQREVLPEHYMNIDAYISKKDGFALIRDELIKAALSNPKVINSALQFKVQKEIVKEAIGIKLIEYNPKTEFFQYKDIKDDFIKDDVLYKVKNENPEIRLLLLYNALASNQELSNTLKFRLQNAKS